MLKFCPNCNNLLVKSTAGNVLKFICKTCSHSEESKASDSLMLDISLTEEESLYKNEIYLNLAAKDHVAPLVERVRQLRIGGSQRPNHHVIWGVHIRLPELRTPLHLEPVLSRQKETLQRMTCT